ncbi:MAG: fumarylacetoacetate hydrolase family protein [Leucobacter sp.]|nr:fumarylacetoacetate hydrolase family protein [Leucobacter sp.]
MTQAIHFETKDGQRFVGRLDGTTITTAGPAPATGFNATSEAWAEVVAANGATHEIGDVHVLAPNRPGKILAIGLNYMSHVEETSLAKPDVPMMFGKFPSSVTGAFDDIVIPREETRPDYEGELGVFISKPAYRVSVEEAWDYVGGFTVLNDVSGRRAQLETPMKQFTLGKSFDTFTPVGPAVVSLDSFADAEARDNLPVRTTLSGEVMQDGNTRQFIFTIPEIVSYLSQGVTLEPGDLIATGTPGGVGDERKPPRYLLEGDVVEVEIPGVGKISNRVRIEA